MAWREDAIANPREIPGVPGPLRPHRQQIPLPRSPLLRAKYRLGGIGALDDELLRRTRGIERVLALGGAAIFGAGVFHGPLRVSNAHPDYRNLRIGSRVHLGAGCLIDLAAAVDIEAEATISMGVTILTHTDSGERNLRVTPRRAEVIIARCAYIGANATILAGCEIGEGAIVGAGSVVTRPVAAGATVAGVPARAV